MDDPRWGEIAVAILALSLMTLIAVVAYVARVTGRVPVKTATEDRADRSSRRRTVRSIIDPQRSWFAALDVAVAVTVAIATGLLAVALGVTFDGWGTAIAILIVSLVYIVLAQGLPYALSRSRPQWSARFVTSVGGLVGFFLRPFGLVVEFCAKALDRLIPDAPGEHAPDGREEELRGWLAQEGEEVIEADEREMIDGILHLEDVRVRDIMVPRVDIVAVERSTPARKIVDTIIKAGHSRIPVYQGSIDHIIGVLYAKDLLPFVIGPTEALPLVSLLRPAYVVPESKKVDDLLEEMRTAKIHLAIVADEYGGTAGIVTFEDVLEEIVGEIQDEYDKEVPLFEIISENELMADGRLAVEDIEDTLDVQFEDDDYGTMGGFVQKHLGRLPQDGDVLTAEGVRIEVIEVERHRVRKMRVTRIDEDDETPESGERDGEAAEAVAQLPAQTTDA